MAKLWAANPRTAEFDRLRALTPPGCSRVDGKAPRLGTRVGLFPLTEWSIIAQARGPDNPSVEEGLRRLAMQYWRPLYLYLRKRGEGHEDASDSVQGFFEFVLTSGFLAHVDREGGRFRSYLLTSLERWRSRERTYAEAWRRGGRAEHLSLDGLHSPEDIDALEDASLSPEEAFDRRWAADMVARAAHGLREDYHRRGKERSFAALSAALPGAGDLPPYAVLATRLGLTEGAVKKAVFDMRAAFAVKLREEIRATVRTNEDAEEELRHLVAVLSQS